MSRARSGERPRAKSAAAPAPLPELPPRLLAAALFLLSFSTVLFTLALFKLLSFFIMPSLFFDLLFIGFPAGAFLGARFFGAGEVSFRKALWTLLAAAGFSIAACLACKHFDYLRAHLFEVEILKLMGQIAVFTGLFIPYFAAYGLSEYVGYQFGRERLRGRTPLVYGLYLFGAAAAYLFLKLALTSLGVSAVLALAVGGIAAALALLSRGRERRAPAAAAAGLLAVAVLPLFLGSGHPIERGFLYLYKGSSEQSSRYYRARENADSRFARWGKYSFCEILWSPVERTFKGLYNDFFQWEYSPGSGFGERSLGAVPLWFVPPGGSAAIIGAGGGRQVRYARKLGVERILALEIEPAVVAAVRGPLAESFDRVYEGKGVEVQVTEARSYMERTAEQFDLIYLPSVGGYPQMMLEPGNMIRTHEAYRTLRDRLKPGGVLAIWYPAGLDTRLILTDQYVRTLRALDLEAVAYQALHQLPGRPREESRPIEYLILACRKPESSPPAAFPRGLERLPELKGAADPGAAFLRILDGFFVAPQGWGPRTAGIPEYPEAFPAELPVLMDPLFTPIPDERPFLAGNIRHILSTEQVYGLFGMMGSVLLVASAVVAFGLRRRGDPGIPGRSYAKVAALSALIGANFLLAEHYLVLALFKDLFVYYDSLMLGAIAFLILSGLGSLLAAGRRRVVVQLLGAVSLLVLLAFQYRLPELAGIGWRPGAPWTFALFAPAALATGTFFPAIFELAARNPLGVFGLDAVGAGLGSLAAFFIPIVFGFQAFFVVAAAILAATVVASALFHRGLGGEKTPAT